LCTHELFRAARWALYGLQARAQALERRVGLLGRQRWRNGLVEELSLAQRRSAQALHCRLAHARWGGRSLQRPHKTAQMLLEVRG
jgi:hypothetical protein